MYYNTTVIYGVINLPRQVSGGGEEGEMFIS